MPRIPGRSTADHIAEIAGKLFYSEGIESLAVDRVSDLAGVTKKTLYKHFGSKELLLAAAVRGESPLAIRDHPGDAGERIAEVFQQLIHFVSQPEFQGCPVLNAAAALSDVRHPARLAIKETRLRRRAWFRERGVDLGASNPDVFADQLIVAFDGGLSACSILRSRTPAHAAAKTATMIVRSIDLERDDASEAGGSRRSTAA